MRWPFTKWELAYLLFLAYCAGSEISSWSDYKSCQEPIQIFTIGFEITFFALFTSVVLLSAPDISDSFHKCLGYFVHCVLNPVCIYLPIQGTIWHVINLENSPDCPAVNSFPMSIWIGIVCTFLVGGFLTYISYLRLRNWWKVYQFRRRMNRLNNMVVNGEYAALNQMLIEAGNLNDKVGLLPGDIEKLERRNFSQSFVDMLSASHLETCPICYEDYKIGDEIVSLPKCSHAFHPECVTEWLMKTPLCPICRRNVRSSMYQVDRQTQNSDYRILEDLENPQY